MSPPAKDPHARRFGLIVSAAWTVFVGGPLLIFHSTSQQLTQFEHLHAAALWIASCGMIFWLARSVHARIPAIGRSRLFSWRWLRKERPPLPVVGHRVPAPPREPLPASFVVCSLWSVVVGIPVFAYHFHSGHFTLLDHVRAAVLFAVSEGLLFWLLERRRLKARRVSAPATSRTPRGDHEAGDFDSIVKGT